MCAMPKTTIHFQHQKSWQALKETLAQTISTCSTSKKLLKCLHGQVISSGLGNNMHLCSLLIRAYFSFQCTDSAVGVFRNEYPKPKKSLLWNTLIRGFLTNGQVRLALDIYQEMTQCTMPDKQTLNLVISACTSISDFELGYQIAECARKSGLESDLLVGTALINMHCKERNLQTAHQIFDRMTSRDGVAWNAMIYGYSKFGSLASAISLFNRMREEYIASTEVTVVSLVSACEDISFCRTGETIHGYIIRTGLNSNLSVYNCLMKMYFKFHLLDCASRLFREMVLKDSISWSTIIGGYVECGCSDVAIKLFLRMVLSEGLAPTRTTLLNTFLACAHLGDWSLGRSIEKQYLNCGVNDYMLDACLSTSLVYMHAKCGRLDISLQLLHENIHVKHDLFAWNAALRACAELGKPHGASVVALQMQRRGVVPDSVTLLVLLSLFSFSSLLIKGVEVHVHVIKRGFDSEISISNALIDMYARSGEIKDSKKVFDGIQDKNVVSWTSIIKGYAWNGYENEALTLFYLMTETDTRPNHITFVAVLTACSHAGYVEKGSHIFKLMKEYGIKPALEHYACMVDLLCRAGLPSEVCYFLENEVPETSTSVFWGAVLNACRVHGNLFIGEVAARHLFQFEPGNAGNYKLLAEIYTLAGRVDDANYVLRSLRTKVSGKSFACSWLEGR